MAYNMMLTDLRSFSSFFNHIDHYAQEEFLYVTSGGIAAAKPALGPGEAADPKPKDTAQPKRKSQREVLAEVEQESEDEQNGTEDN